MYCVSIFFFFFQAEDGIRDYKVTGVQTCALPIFEGYLAANLMIEGLKKAGRDFTTESLVDALEQLRGVDLGVGATMAFGMSEHQASHKVWGTVLDANGNFQALDMD